MKVLYASDSDDDSLDVEHDSYEECASSLTSEQSVDNDLHEKSESSFSNNIPTPGFNNFVQQCMSKLVDNNLLQSLLIKLEQHGHLNDFMMLLILLESGEFPMDNIVFILLLERIHFQNCKNTVGMRYSERTKLFWTVVY